MNKVVISEKKIEAKLVKFCRAHGILTYKFASPSNRGVPDRIFIHGGVVLFLELKREGNTTTALQKHEIQRILAAGGLAAVANSYDEAMQKVVATFMLQIAEKTKRAAKAKPVIEKPRTVVQPVEVAVHGPASDMI